MTSVLTNYDNVRDRATQQHKHLPNAGLGRYLSEYKIIAFNPETKMYLHMSGKGEIKERTFAWVGFQQQFKNLNSGHLNQYDLHSVTEKDYA